MRDIITSDRLILRPLTVADAARVCELVGNFDVSKMLSRVAFPYHLEHAVSWINTHAPIRKAGTDLPYAITSHDDGLIGVIGLHTTTLLAGAAPGAYELGYWLGQPYWGFGYATEAGHAVIAAFDEDLGPKPIVAGHFTENPQSGHVLEKLGFHYAGEASTLYCLARQMHVPHVSMLRSAPAPSSTPIPERSPTP